MIAQSLYDVVSEHLVSFRVIGILKTIMFPFKAPLSTITIIVYKGLVRGIWSLSHLSDNLLSNTFQPFSGGGGGGGAGGLIVIITCNWSV